MPHKILTVVGARPQFIKAAAISRAFANRSSLNEIMVHTGQHFDVGMSEVFFDELSIPTPIHNLKISGRAHGEMTGLMLQNLEKIMVTEEPDMVLIYGDTNSTLAGALAAVKLQVPIAHVEAGLRSFNRSMPEEVNRVITDHISTLLFCPTETSINNLKSEGITQGLHNVGDVMFDATVFATKKARQSSNVFERLGLTADGYAVSTIHRAENTDTRENLNRLLMWLKIEQKTSP